MLLSVECATDEGVYRLLSTLSDLTSDTIGGTSLDKFIPLHVDDVFSNVHDVTLTSFYHRRNQNISQFRKFSEMRSLTFLYPGECPTDEEMNAIFSGCQKLEKIHFRLFSKVGGSGEFFREQAFQGAQKWLYLD